jgi:hypothetical protein
MAEFTSTVSYTIKTVRSGQIRPYADTVHEGIIELDGDWYGKRPDFGRGVVRQALAGIARPFTKEKDDERFWYEAYLDYLEKVEPHVWRFRIVLPYDD